MMMIRLFWQPTYTDLTVSSNGLMGFLMGHRVPVTAMVLVLIFHHFTILALCLAAHPPDKSSGETEC